jgi:uncharacterized membrane-anchored protein
MYSSVARLAVVGWFLLQAPAWAQSARTEDTAEAFESKLGYQTGTVVLNDGATVRVPEDFRFLGPEGSRRLLTEGWGNPPHSADDVLGMLVPAGISPLGSTGWGIVITYEEEGWVNDSDAKTIDYSKLLAEMRDSSETINREREKQGFPPIKLIGWAEPPHYDAPAHKLYWAKELAFGNEGERTLNYNIRILGRRGVLVLNAVSVMGQLPMIRAKTPQVLAAVEFNEGHRYTDYLPGKDKAATYGVAGLIVGASAAKAGLFKMLWVGILAFKKVIVAAIVALGAAAKRLFTREPQEAAVQSVSSDQAT